MVLIYSYVFNFNESYQKKAYEGLNKSAVDHPYKARLNAVGVTLVDALATGPLYDIAQIVACSAYAVFNLVGSVVPLSQDCNLKDCLKSAKIAVRSVAALPVDVGFFPLVFIFQLGAALYDPANVQSLHDNKTFK